ncbi:hypothetical protein llg_29080 [Luteolibacter sp. LG18]|nr:hypothetical protein llg_29080 [Luteolibacter sp. LG18]
MEGCFEDTRWWLDGDSLFQRDAMAERTAHYGAIAYDLRGNIPVPEMSVPWGSRREKLLGLAESDGFTFSP